MEPINVLLVEDDPGDAGIVRYTLKNSGAAHQLKWVESLAAMTTVLENFSPDVILLDLNLPDSTGIATVEAVRTRLTDVPTVVLTGHDDVEFALQTLEAGAQDYLIKGDIDASNLLRAIRYAMSRAQMEKRLLLSEERMSAAIEGGDLGIWEWRMDSDVLILCDRWLSRLGYAQSDPDVTQDRQWWHAQVHPQDTPDIERAIQSHGTGTTLTYQCEFRMRHRDGHWIWIFESGHIVERNAEGRPMRMVGVQQNITERKRLEEKLTELATLDTLTGLPNRRVFIEAVAREYGHLLRRPDYSVSLLMLDIDHFKGVNDNYGHAAGDEVLRVFANTLTDELRVSDVLGRLGGEEFAVVLPDTDIVGATRVAEKLRCVIEAMRVPLESGTLLRITVSIGITLMHPDDHRPDGALVRADKGLYLAKNSGRNRVCVELHDTQHSVMLGEN